MVSALDCGIVVNPDAAANMVEGAIVDGIGKAMYGEMRFTKGEPNSDNFDSYRMIRYNEAPKSIEVHFVQNEIAPTGLGNHLFHQFLQHLGMFCIKPLVLDITTNRLLKSVLNKSIT